MKFKTLTILFSLMCLCLVTKGAEYDRYIVRFNDSINLMSAVEQKIPVNYASVSAEELQDYIDAGIVEYYEPDYLVELHAISDSWNLQAINADFPDYIGCLGNDVTVGVLDSGIVDVFADSVSAGYNYIDGSDDVTDNYGHGTFVTALISSNAYGYATKVNLVPLKCFNDENTRLSTVIDGLVGAVNDFDCDVINMSLGIVLDDAAFSTEGNPKLLKEKIQEAAKLGVIVVSSSGNSGTTDINYPGGFDEVVSVGSVYQDAETLEYQWSPFSNYNETVWVTAPGQGLSLFGTEANGTSFSAPHVTALAAVAKCIDPQITASEFKALLADTAKDMGAEGKDNYFGYGLVDCEAAVKQLISDQKMHISPITKTETTTSSVIYNNTSQPKTVYCICVYLDKDGALIDCNPIEKTIDSGKTYTFENPRFSEVSVKYMVWSDLETMVPQGTAKEK